MNYLIGWHIPAKLIELRWIMILCSVLF